MKTILTGFTEMQERINQMKVRAEKKTTTRKWKRKENEETAAAAVEDLHIHYPPTLLGRWLSQ